MQYSVVRFSEIAANPIFRMEAEFYNSNISKTLSLSGAEIIDYTKT